MEQSIKKQSTSKSFAILGTASIICKVLAIIYLPFQRNIMGDTGNAVVANGYIIFTFLFSLSNAGLPSGISKLVSQQTALGNHKASIKILKSAYVVLLSLGILCGLIMLLGADWIANVYFAQPEAKLMIMWLSPTLILTSVSCALRGYFQGRQNMKAVAISQVFEQLLNTVFTVVFAWLLISKGVAYGAAGTTIGTSIGALGAAAFLSLVFFYLTKKQRRHEIRHQKYGGQEMTTKEVYKQILYYSLPAILSTIATSAPSLIDANLCIRRLMEAGFSKKDASSLYGTYSYQFQRLFTLAIAFSTALVTAMIPAVSSALAVHDNKLLKHRINESYKAIYIVTVPSIVGISFLAHPLISLIWFDLNAPGTDLVAFGTWTAILMTIQYVQTSILIAIGKPVIASVNQIISMVAKVSLNYILIAIPGINIGGAIIATAVSWVIAIYLNQRAIRPSFKFNIYYIRMLFKPAGVSLIMGICCYLFYTAFSKLFFAILGSHVPYLLISDIALIISVVIGIAIYFTLMIKVKGVTKKDILRLPMGGRIYRYAAKVPFLRSELEA
jgi:stage V sporulation protein B